MVARGRTVIGCSRGWGTWACCAIGVCCLACSMLVADNEPASTRYVTTPALEPDRCATAWVVKRFVDPGAVFEFYERDQIPDGVQLYDLPETDLRRDARRATVEVLVQREALGDPIVLRLARLVHDIEIVAWATRRDPDSITFENVLMGHLRGEQQVEDALDVCFELLDEFQAADGDIDRWLDQLESLPLQIAPRESD